MHHQLLIIKYLFSRENAKIDFDSIDTFFDDGVSFPKLISIIYSDNLPDIKEHPSNFSERYDNITNTLLFLSQYEQQKMKRLNGTNLSWHWLTSDTVYFSHRERKKLLSKIFTDLCFPMTPEEILMKSNKILKTINVQYKNVKSIIDYNFLLSLLNVLTDGKVKIIKNFVKKNFEKSIQETFSIAKVPLVIERKDISTLNSEYYFIQIQIIFEVYADKIDRLINDKFYPFDYLEDEALLNTVRELSKNFSNVVNYEDLYKNNFIPKFVLNYFDITSIENVCIENSNENDHNLSENEINNIKSTVLYLSSLKDDFKILTLDFENPSNCEFSSKLFFRTFCNVFFIKNPRIKMIERCVTLLLNKKNWTTENMYSEFSKYDTFLYLAHFCIFGDLNMKLKETDFSDSFALKLFKRGNIPLIVNQRILSNFYYEDILPDSLFYQLQIIYNIIDSFTRSQTVFESLLISKKKLQEIRVPLSEIILLKVKSQTAQIIYDIPKKDEKSEKEKSGIENVKERQKTEIDEVKKTDEKQKKCKTEKGSKNKKDENKNILKNEANNVDDESFLIKYQEEAEKYWDDYYGYFHLCQGILYNDKEKFEDENLYDKRIAEVLDDVKEKEKEAEKKNRRKRKNKKEPIQPPPKKEPIGLFTPPEFDTSLYKIIYYDEINDKWVFDSEAFEQFAEASNLKSANIKCPLIFYLPAEESDLMQINSLFIKGMYPLLEAEEEEEEEIDEPIYVYPFCDKTLAEIYNDMHLPYTSEQEKIKPIFLLVHTPKKKENFYRIDVIMLRLYIFLSLISDLKVVAIYGKNTYFHQGSSVDIICGVSNSVSLLGSPRFPYSHMDGFEILTEYFKEREDKKNLDCVYNGKHLKIKEHKLIYLFDKSELEYKENYYNNDQYQEDFNRILPHEQNAIISLIDILNFETYKNYIDVICDVSLKSTTNYSDLKNNFLCIDASCICNRFFKMIYRQLYNRSHDDVVVAVDHFDYLYSKIYKNESETSHFERIQKNLDDHIPQYCQFMRILSKIIIDDKRMNKRGDSDVILKILGKTKENFIEKVKEQFNRKQIWTKNEIESVVDKLNCLLRNEFFKATKQLERSDEDHLDMFQYHMKDLEFILSKSEEDIKEIFKEYFEEMETKNSVKLNKFEDEINEGANYTVKEIENTREITVEVEINSDLKSVIQQDF